MIKKTMAVLVATILMLALTAPTLAASDTETHAVSSRAAYTYNNVVYLGVYEYGSLENSDKDSFYHCFSLGGQTAYLYVSSQYDYYLQNLLAEGYIYNITVSDGVVTNAQPTAYYQGTVQGISNDSITISGRAIPLTAQTQVFAIQSRAGGAQVTPIDFSSLPGRTAKVCLDANGYAEVIYQTFVAQPYTAPVSGQPGVMSLKNFLATALEPVGTTLYVYGGTWNWQDTASSWQARTIGLPQSWIDFFQSQDASYTYRIDKSGSNAWRDYYPHGSWNQYYYAGADCSGYVGWVLYNTMNITSFGEDRDYYVGKARSRASALAQAGFGTVTKNFSSSDFKPGDVFSMDGHVWICLGRCADGSMVIAHSTTSENKYGTGQGGGVQLSGVGWSQNCQAVRLADYYMKTYYPTWSARYNAVFRSYDYYTDCGSRGSGKFSWNILGNGGSNRWGLTDAEGFRNMSADQILAILFTQPSAPEPTPDPTPEPTPDPTPEPTPDSTPSPAPSADNWRQLCNGVALNENGVISFTQEADSGSLMCSDFVYAHSPFTAANLLEYLRLEDGVSVQILNENLESAQEGEILKTGQSVLFEKDGEPVLNATIAVCGDVLGTGKMALSQVVRLVQAYQKVRPLEGVYLEAGDFGKTNEITLTDVVHEVSLLRVYSMTQ